MWCTSRVLARIEEFFNLPVIFTVIKTKTQLCLLGVHGDKCGITRAHQQFISLFICKQQKYHQNNDIVIVMQAFSI